MIAAVDLSILVQLYDNIVANSAVYKYGMKPAMTADSHGITGADCSGLSRYLLFKASGGKLNIPDGSQAQREWFEISGAHQLKQYSDITYADESRAFICFLKPGEHGTGAIGHVWIVHRLPSGDHVTIEAHGPEDAPIGSRPWDYHTLLNEWWSGFELNVIG